MVAQTPVSMDPAWAAVILAGLSLVVTLYQTVIKRDTLRADMTLQFAKVESRVEILWGLLFRRGIADALAGGLLQRESPVKLNLNALRSHGDIVSRIKNWYYRNSNMTDLELMIELEANFGPELQLICDTNDLKPGACLAAMVFMVRPDSGLFKKFDSAQWETNANEEMPHGGPDIGDSRSKT